MAILVLQWGDADGGDRGHDGYVGLGIVVVITIISVVMNIQNIGRGNGDAGGEMRVSDT